jgi:CDP-diacylglycerol--glycerol-3-phosphate 3-phosphatidyltransferase
MYMTNENITYFPHDRVLGKTIIPLIPSWIRPNHVTILRFLLTPVVLWLLFREQWGYALSLFVFTAFTDAVDGSLARLRRQITSWGTVADPIADKLFIGSVVVLFVAREINVLFAVFIVFMECLILFGGLIRRARGKGPISANEYGKIKMFLQVLGVTLLIVARLFGLTLAVPFATGTFAVALVFALVSFYTYGL